MIWVKIVYLGDDFRKFGRGVGKWDREGSKVDKGCFYVGVIIVGWDLILSSIFKRLYGTWFKSV